MTTAVDLGRTRRRIYLISGIFLLLSVVVCTGSYFGWFGWVIWAAPPPDPRLAFAEGKEAIEFIRRLTETEARFARDDVRKLREMLEKLDLVRDARYRKYADETQGARRAPEPLTDLPGANPTPEESLAVSSDLGKQDLFEVYQTAKNLSKRMHDVYRVFRSCELARIQRLSLRKAFDATDVVPPKHPDVDVSAFRGTITSTASEGMKRLKDAMGTVRIEIKGMIGTGTRMLDLAAILEPGLLGGGSFLDFANSYGQMWGIRALMPRPRTMFQGTTGADPNAFEHEWGRGEGPITKRELGLPVQLGIDLSKTIPLPGRKLLKDGPGAEWMFVNTWYIIGPFPNPDRRNLEEKFPPEASLDPTLGFVGIDLDARYVGMGQQTIRWEYVATDRRVCFIPPVPEEWAIWYAYTEIWSETDQDKFCIFGSDDWGKCWINGEEVFVSGITPHPWIPDRKYAKVSFRQGFNPVLFKLENTWGRTGWSLCVYTGKVATQQQASAPKG